MKKITFLLTACLLMFQVAKVHAQTNITAEFSCPIFVEKVREAAGIAPGADILDTDVANITELNVSGYGITSLNGLQYFSGLIELDCSYNNLGGLPSLPPNLEVLICSNNRIEGLPYLTGVMTYLNCSNNKLPALPSLSPVLEYLDCGNNLLTALPELSSVLIHLDCSSNEITVLSELPGGLVRLNCADNQISVLPGLPGTLKSLNCSHNMIAELPTLPELTHLICNNNELIGLPTFPGTLKELNCSYNKLPGIPPFPGGMEYIDISYNELTGLNWIVGLSNLTHFLCAGNQLTAMMTCPPSLTHLDVSNNLFYGEDLTVGHEYPAGTWNPRKLPAGLEWLDVSKNDLTGLDVTGLNALGHLDCSENRICRAALQGIDIAQTGLIFLPQNLSGTVPPTFELTSLGADIQVVLIGNDITTITYSITGATGVEFAGRFPEGITGVFDPLNNQLTISGNVDIQGATGIYNYTVVVFGDCGITSIYGRIVVRGGCHHKVFDHVNNEIYSSVLVADVCWLRENLRNKLYQDGTEIPFAKPYDHLMYPNIDDINFKEFGLLYDYESVMGGAICPDGWGIPTAEEWDLLKSVPAVTLKTAEHWLDPNTNTNSTDFNLRAAGYYNNATERFEELYGYTAFWSFETSTSSFIPAACFTHACPLIEIKEINKVDGVSVRCVQKE